MLRRRKQQLSFLHFPGHISNNMWYEFVARIKESGCDKEKLMSVLIELAKDPKFEPVFPSLVPGAEEERWHFIDRVKGLEIMKTLPADLSEPRKLVLAILHTALAPQDGDPSWQNDKPFRAELEAARNLVFSFASYCESCSCEWKAKAVGQQ